MNFEGLIWFDNDTKRPVREKIERGAVRYEQKHGQKPNICLVHQGDETEVPGIRVLQAKSVLPFHYWLGQESE